jgi:nicotinamidase-related amidase
MESSRRRGIAILPTPPIAQTIIDEWQNVKTPPAPTLKDVTVGPKTTALLVLDLVKQTSNSERRPCCVASIPKIQKLLAEARASGTMVIYTRVPPVATTDTLPEIAPKDGEPVVVSFVDKFTLNGQDTGLDKMLKDKGSRSVITVGTAAHGAVLYTASAAALRGYNVIVPVDSMSGDAQNTYIEQFVAHDLTSAPIVAPKVTLTSVDKMNL